MYQEKTLDLEMCSKYFEFLNEECDKYISDGIISEDELMRIQSELKRIKSMVRLSNLRPDIKGQIETISLKYKISTKSKFIKIINMIIASRLESYYHSEKMKESIIDVKSQILETILILKMRDYNKKQN